MTKELEYGNLINALKRNGYPSDMAQDVAMQIEREIRWGDPIEDVLWSYGVTLAEAGLA